MRDVKSMFKCQQSWNDCLAISNMDSFTRMLHSTLPIPAVNTYFPIKVLWCLPHLTKFRLETCPLILNTFMGSRCINTALHLRAGARIRFFRTKIPYNHSPTQMHFGKAVPNPHAKAQNARETSHNPARFSARAYPPVRIPAVPRAAICCPTQ